MGQRRVHQGGDRGPGRQGGTARRVRVVRIADLESYVSQRVKDLTGGKQRPMTAKPKTIEDFPIAAVPPF